MMGRTSWREPKRAGARLWPCAIIIMALLAPPADAASRAKQCRRECKSAIEVCHQGCVELRGRQRKKCRKACKRSTLQRCKTEGVQACMPSDDPCDGATSCDVQIVGGEQVTTGGTDTGYRSVIEGPTGIAEITWTVSGTSTSFQYRPAGGMPGPVVTVAGTPADAAGVSNAAMLLHRTRGAEGVTFAYTGPNTLANTSGCDQLHELDCGPIGKCCDVHDDCINQHCGGQGECGNVLGALEAAYGPAPCSADCLQCHGAVVKCFFDGSHPGPSDCCDDGDCGRAQECMINGRVVTDPCECEDSGITSVTGCPQDCGECTPNFDGCLPDGTLDPPSSRCCCSCAIRIGPSTFACDCQDDCCPNFPDCEPAGANVIHYSACCSCSVGGGGLQGTCE